MELRGSDGARSGLRRANEARVVDALRRLGPSSQAQLARECGLSRATVNNVVRSLERDEVVTVRAGANGRETTVSLERTSGVVVGLDFGHQHLHGMVASFGTKTRRDVVVPLDRDHEAEIDVDVVMMVVRELIQRDGVDPADLIGVCMGVHAPFDPTVGEMSPSAILPGWSGMNVPAVLSARLGFPVFVDNDANFAALAEWTWGVGRGYDDFLYVRSSNGLGAGLVLGGHVYRGGNGMAGELGHVVVHERGALCNCGNRGCLSAVASGRSLLLQLQLAGQHYTSLRAVIEAANAGDAACTRVLQDAGRYIGIALSHAVKLVAPGMIAIGGEMAVAGDVVLDAVRASIAENALRAPGSVTQVSAGFLRSDMSLLGMVAHALQSNGGGIAQLPEWLLDPMTDPTPGFDEPENYARAPGSLSPALGS